MEGNIKKIDRVLILAIVCGTLGFVIVTVYLILLGTSGHLIGWSIDPEYMAITGTFIGGTVGAVWTLTGVLLYYTVIKNQKEESQKSETRHREQIDLLNLQKFQNSFFELFKLFLDKRNELTNSARRNEDNTKNIYAFNELTHDLIEYAGEYNEMWDNGKSYNSGDIFPLHDSYKEKIIEFCELLILILHEIYSHPEREKVLIYERMLFNVLTLNQIASIIHCAVFDSDGTGRLINALLNSELWEIRCIVLLNQIPEISTFWTRYSSTIRSKFP